MTCLLSISVTGTVFHSHTVTQSTLQGESSDAYVSAICSQLFLSVPHSECCCWGQKWDLKLDRERGADGEGEEKTRVNGRREKLIDSGACQGTQRIDETKMPITIKGTIDTRFAWALVTLICTEVRLLIPCLSFLSIHEYKRLYPWAWRLMNLRFMSTRV